MWRSPGINLILRRALTPRPAFTSFPRTIPSKFHRQCSTETNNNDHKNGSSMSQAEAKKLMRLAHVEALKDKLEAKDQETISHDDLIQTCLAVGIAKSNDEASAFAKVLDDAGVVLLFRDKVYLHPDKVIDLIRKALSLDGDDCSDELRKLQETKEEIDVIAHKQVRRVLWTGLGLAVMQAGLFFRLTFWEFSWDVMEPIAFFTTTAGIVTGYAYFMFTSRDPSYEDVLKRLFHSRQRKIIQNRGFDVHRFIELQKKHKLPLDSDLLHGY